MTVVYNVLLVLSVVVALVFTGLVFLTGKGDAMSSGGSGVRTTFKGKASFDDQISRVTLMLGGFFMLSMLVLDWLGTRIFK